jgi:meso-butanediol dehydrogenase/(S,S)-butanediol dehydrogenase/diacetyl reductase
MGFAIAMRLQKEGAAVVTAQRGEASGFESISADFTDPESPARVVDAVIKLAGRLDILVNNAGVMQEATAEEMKLEDWQTALFVNLTAPSS